MAPPLDARLVLPAVVCWSVTLTAIVAGCRIGLLLAGGLAVSAIAVAAWLFRSGRRHPVAVVVLAGLVTGAGFAVAGAWHEGRVAAHSLRQLVPGTVVTVVAVPTDDPKPLPARGFGPRQWMVRADLREYRSGSGRVRAGGAVIVLAQADGWSALLPGQQVEFRARLENPWRRDLTVAVLRARGRPGVVMVAPWWQRAAGAVRGRLVESAARTLPADAAGLLPGLVDGDVSRLPDRIRENFQQTDLTHLVAVSGTNVTIILMAVSRSVDRLTVDRRLGIAISAIALLAFVILARPSPTVLRAALMGAIAVLATALGRRKQALPALCAAVIGLIAYDPALAVDIGFALSVLATAGLIVLSPGWSQWLEQHGWPHRVAEGFAIATSAFLVTTPLLAALTGHVGLLAILVNVLVEPAIAPITILGTLAAVTSCVCPPLADLLLRLTILPLRWLLSVSEHGASLGVSLSVPNGVRGGIAAGAVVVVVIAVLVHVTRGVPASGESTAHDRDPGG
ncbi:ComEC/Rec2 family competence protein [Nocardia sp. alder85J]|uniref:ComEC/Rec2 family competence protein n=1 Tax=Nocardia sp. alder85J TaxID=2862949 RepID=UPI001CD70278|nr:ComEC/Rec2 family competence protein [Nocardia sp. alder85J]MCX4097480.1 ComEC/Rec2 family competence protein [Nocardia sp. alder85J]